MKKNDKLIALLGVAILILAAIGVFYWTPEGTNMGKADFDDIIKVTGKLSADLDHKSITVSDEDPFYALAATPLAAHYDAEGMLEIIPLYVENLEDPSSAIERLQRDELYHYEELDLDEMDYTCAKEFSLGLAENCWEKSSAALILEDSDEGYCLGVNAVPMASYLSIPVIVTDEFDGEVNRVLELLGVEKVIICGENLKEYEASYEYIEYETVEQIVENMTYLVKEKFGDLDYITMANPIDAFTPKVLAYKNYSFGPEKVGSTSMNRGSSISFMLDYFTAKIVWDGIKIPDDFKYALIEVEGFNHELDGVDMFGDGADFDLNPVGEGPTMGAIKTSGGETERDAAGNLIEDRGYEERVMYDYGGREFTLTASGSWTLHAEGEVSANVVIKKLDSPYYPMMKSLSSVAPYLAAYHKGIVFAKEEFAFTADDDVITADGKTCPGYYLPGRNPALVPMSNKHVYDNIHEPLNHLLADIAGLPYEKNSDLEYLQDYYKEDPVYIALVGGAMGLPRIVYQNQVEPIHDVDGDGVDDTVALNFGGGGTQSDNIYGNIDPVMYEWSNLAGDVYTADSHPYLENIVGRITGWDVQDADALIVRTIFYNDLLDDLGEWKDNYGNLFGGGLDFRKPLWVQTLNHIPVIKQIIGLAYSLSGHLLNFGEGPWKYDTGFSRIMCQAVESEIGEDLGFEVLTALHEAAMVDGLSDKALDEIKTASLWNRLTFNKNQVRALAGEGNVHGKEILENSNFIWATGHGSIHSFGMDGLDLVAAGFDGVFLNAPNLWSKFLKNTILPHFVGGFWGPGGGLGKVGEFSPREMTDIDFGPSFMWLESCFCGKMTGVYPEANIGQSFIHSGVNALVASTTGSNIPGGYLEGKGYMFDTKIGTEARLRQAQRDAEKGIFPEFHFGVKIYDDMCHILADEDATVGQAFQEAKNIYIKGVDDWSLWWSPPLSSGGDAGYGPHLPEKYTSFFEYVLYGDPAFNPYEPVNEA